MVGVLLSSSSAAGSAAGSSGIIHNAPARQSTVNATVCSMSNAALDPLRAAIRTFL